MRRGREEGRKKGRTVERMAEKKDRKEEWKEKEEGRKKKSKWRNEWKDWGKICFNTKNKRQTIKELFTRNAATQHLERKCLLEPQAEVLSR